MSKFKSTVLDTSLFRRLYIACMFMCNISILIIPAYLALAVLFLWGCFLVIYNTLKKHTIRKTRYGFWLFMFLVMSLVTALTHISGNVLYNAHNVIMIMHVAICFFIFYSVHTEKHLNFRREMYSVCRFVVYTTTVLGLIGLACMMAGIRFEVMGLKFIVFDNRFTGMYANPNQLGFTSVVAIFLCHTLLKKDFIAISGRERVSNIWIGSCVAVNGISLLLCDSNGSIMLMISYAIFFVIYKMFGSERKFTAKQIITKSLASLLAGVVIVSSLLFVRNVTQLGFTELMKAAGTVVVIDGDMDAEGLAEDGIITFEHENKNVDSGRFKLWMQAAEMFKVSPAIGVGKGNIYEYGLRLFEKGVKFSNTYGVLAPLLTDFHNGYFTILVCSGVVGFALFAVFGVKLFRHITPHVFRQDSLRESVLPCMYSFLCAYLIYATIEEALLFNVIFMVVFFWLILGYTSCFMTHYEPDHPLQHVTFAGIKLRKTFF